MVFAKRTDEGRSATPTTDRKKRRVSTDLSETEQRQRAREWAEKQNIISSPVPHTASASSASTASASATVEKPRRGRAKAETLAGSSPIPAVIPAPVQEVRERPSRKIKKPVLSDDDEVVVAAPKRRVASRKSVAKLVEESPVETPKKAASPSPKKASTPKIKPAASSFLPESIDEKENDSARKTSAVSTTAAEDEEYSGKSCCFGLISCSGSSCGDCDSVHVVVGIVLLSWFIALFIDGTVGASCLIVAVIISSLRRFVDFLCESCSTRCEKGYCNKQQSSDNN